MTQLLPVASAAQVRHALAELARPHRLRITLAGLVLVAGTATVLLAPPLLGAIVDLVVGGAPAAAITGPVLGLVGVAVAAGVLDALGRALVASSGEPILAALRENVVDRALAVPPDAIERAGTGDLVSRVSGDVAAVSELFGEALPALARSALMVGLTLVGWPSWTGASHSPVSPLSQCRRSRCAGTCATPGRCTPPSAAPREPAPSRCSAPSKAWAPCGRSGWPAHTPNALPNGPVLPSRSHYTPPPSRPGSSAGSTSPS